MARYHCFQVISFGNEFSGVPPRLTRNHRRRKHERQASIRFEPSVCERDKNASQSRGSASSDLLHPAFELGLKLSSVIRQRAEQEITADATNKRRIHNAQVKFRNRRLRHLRKCSTRADGFSMRVIESHLRLNLVAGEEIQAAQLCDAVVES